MSGLVVDAIGSNVHKNDPAFVYSFIIRGRVVENRPRMRERINNGPGKEG